jgi:hypothetical protein
MLALRIIGVRGVDEFAIAPAHQLIAPSSPNLLASLSSVP